jgi:hypothetical protein
MKSRLLILVVPLLLLLTACPPDPPPTITLEPPTGLAATPADGQVTLNWQASNVKNVANYIVKIETAGNTPEEDVVSIPATAYTIKQLSNGKAYTFSIAIETKDKKRSGFSKAVSATPKGSSTGGGGEEPKVSTPTGLVAAAGDASVILNWNANPETDLKGYTIFYGTTPTTFDKSKSVDASTTMTVIDALSNSTTYFFALEAENTKGEKSARSSIEVATPIATPVEPVIESVTIEDNGSSLQVRQGAAFAMLVKGQRLGTVSATLGTLSATVSNNTDTEARLEFTVPHGQPLDFLALSLTTAGGTLVKSNAVEVSPIAVAKNSKFSPNDNNPGTKERPFITLTQALSVAAAGDTILLGPGTYEGESWPSGGAFPPNLSPNVPNGVTIVGQSKSSVILQGLGNPTVESALVFAGSAVLKNVTITDFHRALVHTFYDQGCYGDILLENVDVSQSFDGVVDFGACSLTVKNSVFDVNSSSGIAAFSTYSVSIETTTLTGNAYGIYGSGVGSLNVTNTITTKSVANGIHLEDVYIANLQGVEATENDKGIYVKSLENIEFRLRSSTLSDNRDYGIEIAGGGFSSWDLGTAAEPGNNQLENNTVWQLFDNRAANTGNTIQAKGNTINGQTLNGVKSQTDNSTGLPNLWQIAQPGNSIEF